MKTIKTVAQELIFKLLREGKDKKTLDTYSRDLDQILRFFGEDKIIDKILAPHITLFLKSDEFSKKIVKGEIQERALETTKKTKRVLRMLLEFSKEKGYTDKVYSIK